MKQFRILPLAIVLGGATLLAACTTAPQMPMGGAQAAPMDMAMPGHMAMMDGQMKTMGAMHERMKAARTPDERSRLMADHMKAMQGGMAMMGGMGGMGGMKGMADMKPMPGMSGEMAAHHQMMAKRMEMMQLMMTMMMERMPAGPGG